MTDYPQNDFGYEGLVRFRQEIQDGRPRYVVRMAPSDLDKFKKLGISEDCFSDLTIGVTAFNRPHYLVACLDYMYEQFPGARIIVADASTEENKNIHRSKISEIMSMGRRINIEHYEFESEYPWLDIIEKIVSVTDSEYFLKWDDDDFYNPRGVREAIGIMNAEPSVVCMTGPSVNLTCEDVDTLSVTGHIAMTFEDQDMIKRLTFVGLTATQVWNHLFRTDVFRQSLQRILYLRGTRIDQLWDHGLTIEIALRGICRATRQVFLARRAGVYRASENVYSRGRDAIYKLIDPEQSQDYVKFRENVGETLDQHLLRFGPEVPRIALDEVCKCLFIACCGNEPLFRPVHREFVVTHPQTEAWLHRVRTDDQCSRFLASALSVVVSTDLP